MIQQKQDWDIRSRNEQCVRCERGFSDGETFQSRLTYGEEGYQRTDFCVTCWEAVKAEPTISAWQSVFLLPPPPPPEALKRETAESLLRKLIEEGDPNTLNTIYILAVMLERRRLLVEKDVQRRDDGTLLRVYEYRKTNEVFLITDPELKLAELEHVQNEVITLLGNDSNGTEEKPEEEKTEDEESAPEEDEPSNTTNEP